MTPKMLFDNLKTTLGAGECAQQSTYRYTTHATARAGLSPALLNYSTTRHVRVLCSRHPCRGAGGRSRLSTA